MSLLNTLALGAFTATQAVAPAQVAVVHPAPPTSTAKTSNFSIEYQYPNGNIVSRYNGAGSSDATGTFATPFTLDYYMNGTMGAQQSDYLKSHKVTIKPSNEADLLRLYPTKESEISLPRIVGFIDPKVTSTIDKIAFQGTQSNWFAQTDKNTGIYSTGITPSRGESTQGKFGNEIYGVASAGQHLKLEVDIDDIYEEYTQGTGMIEFNTEFFFDVDSGLVSPTKTGTPSADFNVTTVGHRLN